MPLKDIFFKFFPYLIYGIIAIVPLVYFPTGMHPFQVAKTVVFQGAVEILFASYLVFAIFDKKYRPAFTPIFFALMAFLLVLIISTIFAADWKLSLFSDEQRSLGVIAISHFVALFAALKGFHKEIDWDKLFLVSMATSVLVSLIAILQFFIAFKQESVFHWIYILFQGSGGRVGSTFSNAAFLAGYLAFNFFLALYFIGRSWKRDKKVKESWLYILSAAVILAGIFLSQTLGVFVGLSAGVILLLIYLSFTREKELSWLGKYSLGTILIFVLFAGVLFGTSRNSLWQKIPGLNRVSSFSLENVSVSTRLMAWKIAVDVFKDKPILGWGPENFRIGYNAHYNPKMFTLGVSGTYWDKPHNVLLEYLATTGVVGLLSYCSLFVVLFYVLWKKRKEFGHLNSLIFGAMLTAYFIQNLFIFDNIGTYLMFFLFLAFIDSYGEKREASPSVKRQDILSYSLALAFLVALVPVYFNYQILNASRWEFHGTNSLLHKYPQDSLISFKKALAQSTPYRDDIRKSFASMVTQAYKQGIEYPDLPNLQKDMIVELKKVIENHPKDFFNYVALADFYNVFYKFDLNYPEEAEPLSIKALELSPNRQQVYYVLAATRFAKGDTKGAYKTFEEVVNLNPESGDSHFFYGLMAYGVGDIGKGRSEIKRAADMGRKSRSSGESMLLGDFLADKEENYEEAIDYYNLALSQADKIYGEIRDQSILQILLKLGVAYYYAGDKESSGISFKKLKNQIDLRTLPIYPQLQPMLKEVDAGY